MLILKLSLRDRHLIKQRTSSCVGWRLCAPPLPCSRAVLRRESSYEHAAHLFAAAAQGMPLDCMH